MIENILIVVFTVPMLVGSILGWRLERSELEKKERKIIGCCQMKKEVLK